MITRDDGAPSVLDLLDADAFTCLLLQMPIKSLAALEATSRRFRDVIASPSFLKERLHSAMIVVDIDQEDPRDGEDETDCVFSASVFVDAAKVGSFTCTLISRAGNNFFSACDEAATDDVLRVASTLFDPKGKARLAALKADPSVQRGGYLYINIFKLRPRYESTTDVASAAIAQLLALDGLTNRWDVAAYIGDPAWPWPRRHPPTDEQKRAASRRQEKDCRAFVRARFEEVTEAPEDGYMYATRTMVSRPALSHEEALKVPLRAAQAAQATAASQLAQTDLDKELLAVVVRTTTVARVACRQQIDYTPMLAEVDRLVSAGASIDRACALHCAAHNVAMEALVALCDRGADVNAVDMGGRTPLMAAAVAVNATYHPLHNPLGNVDLVIELLKLGADKSRVDPQGKSALGYFRQQRCAAARESNPGHWRKHRHRMRGRARSQARAERQHVTDQLDGHHH